MFPALKVDRQLASLDLRQRLNGPWQLKAALMRAINARWLNDLALQSSAPSSSPPTWSMFSPRTVNETRGQ